MRTIWTGYSRLLRDLDKGFWRFCSSFNDKRPFIAELKKDPVYENFRERMGADFFEVEPSQWALLGDTRGMRQNVMVMYSVRPSAPLEPVVFPRKGGLYHFTFSTTPNCRRTLDYRQVLEFSKPYHPMLVYIILDSFQDSLYVSVPALYPPEQIIKAAECFYEACGRMFHDFLS
jgi:hypothetical protein